MASARLLLGVVLVFFFVATSTCINVLDQPHILSAGSKLAEKQKKFEDEAGGVGLSAPVVEIDWDSFIDSDVFKGKSDGTRKSIIENVVTDVVHKGLFASDNGFVAWTKKSPVRGRTILLTAIGKIVVQLVPDNKVDTKEGNSYYGVEYNALERTLYVKVKLDSVSYTDGWGPKIDKEFDLNVLNEVYINGATEQLNERQKKFATELSDATLSVPTIEVNWTSFVDSATFKAKSDGTRKSIIESVVTDVVQKGLFASESGFVAWSKKSPTRARVILLASISKIVINVAVEGNKVETGPGNSYYGIKFDGDVLNVTVKLDSVTYTDGWGPKVDDVFGLHVLDEVNIRAVTEKIKDYEKKFNADLAAGHLVVAKDVPTPFVSIEVDWDTFVRHANFLTKSDGTRKSIIESVADDVIRKGLLHQDQGLQKKWLAESARVKKIFLDKVNRLLIKFTPDGKGFESGPGNSYYSVHADDNNTLIITVKLDSVTYTDGWGPKVDNALGMHFLDELYIKAATEKLVKHQETLQKELAPQTPKIIVDWASFVHNDTFLTKSDGTRKSNIEEIPDGIVRKGLFATSDGGLVGFFKADPELKLSAVVIKLASSIDNSGPGNSYYKLAVSSGPTIIATVKGDSLSYTDSFKNKLVALHEQIKQESSETNLVAELLAAVMPQTHVYLQEVTPIETPIAAAYPIPTHEYLLPAPLEELLKQKEEAKNKALLCADGVCNTDII